MVERLLAALSVWLFVIVDQASAECPQEAGRLVSVQGQVEVQRAGQPGWQTARLEETLCPGDSVRVEELGRAAVRLANETVLRLDQHSAVTFPTPEKAATSWLEILRGAVYLISRAPRESQVKTPIVTAALRGTEFLVRVDPTETLITVYEGEVLAGNAAGSLTLTSGQTGVAKAGAAPVRWIVVKPRDAVQWTLYYPPVIDVRAKAYRTGPAAPTLQATLARYRQNDLPAAFASLDAVPAKLRDENYHTLRAQLLLLVGRVDEARSAIKETLSRNPANATALSLQTIIAVTQNDKAQALQLAEQAVEREPQSPVPYIALSYAQQADFAIDKALASVQEAVRLNPENALAWARAAELQLSKGDLDRALDAAQQAVAHDPKLARTQSVLGFSYLTRIDIDKAKTAFDQAIQRDQADPLARLGLGLAKIRKGYLQEGREEIEIATGLDPSNSLIRSYLGKAYYEEKRDQLSADQLAIAKELDPKDPTPWFYDAIRKQTENRPVEALRDLEQSIELNDNRAVYRSKLLLDQDRAARETSLARIYDDLGFEQLAQVEATKSLSLDPANYSAHRFLSDSYASRPRHEIARVSELLQAQLLEPININPVQPSLAETRLNIAGAGPAQAAFNEFTPLFESNRPQFTASGLVGNYSTLADEMVLSGIQGPLSYSLGQFHYETDGFRKNNGQQHDIYNIFAQWSVTPEFNLQAEYRRRETEQGDLRLNFDPNTFDKNYRRDVDQNTVRLGGRISPSSQSDIVVSLIYSDLEEVQSNIGTENFGEDEGRQAEIQYLFRDDRFSLTAGLGSYAIDQHIRNDFIPCHFSSCPLKSNPEVDQYNAYIYANLFLPWNLVGTIGFSYDSFERGDYDSKEFNPKLGLQWNINDNVRLRIAAFETMKRPLVVDQTVEPTQIAGFNQFFDDINGTKTKRYGIGVDSRLADKLYGGAEISRRDLEVPSFPLMNTEDPNIIEDPNIEDQQEDFYFAYLYWIPHPNWALRTEYQFEKLEAENLNPSQIKTTSVPLAIRYFRPSGLFGELSMTYVKQKVDFEQSSTNTINSDNFFLFDAIVGYRLPKRRGILSLEARNLFDQEFHFQDMSFRTSQQWKNPQFIPERLIFARMNLNF